MFPFVQRYRPIRTTLLVTYRLPFIAAVWVALVGMGAYGLSKLAPEGEAAAGVVLAAIALGAYRLTGWALDLLAPLFVELAVWPLLGNRKQPGGFENESFSSAFRLLHSSGRDIHFTKNHPLQEAFKKEHEELKKTRAALEKLRQQTSSGNMQWVNITPRCQMKAETMLDISGVMSEHSLGEEDLKGILFEMPDGSHWEVPRHASTASGIDGAEGSRSILMQRVI